MSQCETIMCSILFGLFSFFGVAKDAGLSRVQFYLELLCKSFFMAATVLLVFVFLWKLKAKRRKMALLLVPFYILALYYGSSHFFGFSTLLVLQFSVIYICMLSYYKAPPKKLFFLALMYYLCNRAARSIFQTPILASFVQGSIGLLSDWFMNRFLAWTVVIPVFMTLVILLVRRLVPVNEIVTEGKFRYVASAALVAFYVNTYFTKFYYQNDMDASPNVSLLLILQCLAIIGFVILSERYLIMQKKEREQEQAAAMARRQYENVLRMAESQETVRHIYHDLKNHIIVLRSTQGDAANFEEYLRAIDDELHAYENVFNTGNSLLDSLLREKAQQAQKFSVELKIYVDFSAGGFVNPMDISVIFGNALDNAIEAAAKLEDPRQRLVSVKAGAMSGMLTIKIVNCFDSVFHALQPEGEGFATTKPDGERHGIGLRSIQHSVNKYGGTLSYGVEAEYYFALKILLPIAKDGQVL